MTSRERIRRIIAREPADRCGLWLGMPMAESWKQYHAHFGTTDNEELRRKLGDDYRWLSVWSYRNGTAPMFPIPNKQSHGDAGPFANVTDPKALDDYEWPTVANVDFPPTLTALRNAGDVYRASGLWTPFYHNVMDLFGMEAYLINMHEDPALVQAVTDRVCQFYYDANEAFFKVAGREVDGFFFGNDFGTQLDTICSPAHFDQFVLPWFRTFTAQGHRWGYQVILHSCGSIYRVLDRLITAGVDCLHPLQARARNMEAEHLAREFKDRVAFLGGIDTQDLLVNGTPDDVRADVRRVKRELGPHLIVSPSHEAVLPNVPAANLAAMAEAALE